MTRRRDITEQRFSYLTAIRMVGLYRSRTCTECLWEFKCDCGKIIIKRIGQITQSKHSHKSCGCKSRYIKSITKLGKKNPNWCGDKIGYKGVHDWVRKFKNKPKFCQCCKKVPPYDLANISNKYNKKTYTRDLKNWEWLCRSCHMKKDGRLKKFIKHKTK